MYHSSSWCVLTPCTRQLACRCSTLAASSVFTCLVSSVTSTRLSLHPVSLNSATKRIHLPDWVEKRRFSCVWPLKLSVESWRPSATISGCGPPAALLSDWLFLPFIKSRLSSVNSSNLSLSWQGATLKLNENSTLHFDQIYAASIFQRCQFENSKSKHPVP